MLFIKTFIMKVYKKISQWETFIVNVLMKTKDILINTLEKIFDIIFYTT